MDPFTAAMIVGTGIQMYGNYKANMDQAKAERENQVFMEKQRDLIKKSTAREISLFEADSQHTSAAFTNTLAKNGISMEGTAMELRRQNELYMQLEMDAINEMGNMRLLEADAKIRSSANKQSQLTSGFNNAIQAGSIGVSGGMAARNTYRDEQTYRASQSKSKTS